MVTHTFQTGDRVDAISVAGEPFTRYTHGPIWAEVFTIAGLALVPLMRSVLPGSGTLDAFLDALVAALPDTPILFLNVVNPGLRARLLARGFAVVDADALEQLAHDLDVAIRRPR